MPRLFHLLILCLGSQALAVADAAPSTHALFRSADRGRTWTRSDAGMPGTSRINALAASPSHHFAGTDAGIFVSADSGATWRGGGPIEGKACRILCLAVVDKSLFAGTDANGIVVSNDEGASWERVDREARSPGIRSLLRTGGVLYAGLDAGGVLRSNNRGMTRVLLGGGMPAGAQVFAMAELGGAVFAALYTKGLYRLDVPGGHWSRIGNVFPLALVAVGETLVVGHNAGGIFWSSDLGQSWQPSIGDLPPNAPVWAMASDRALVLAGVADGIYRSDDKGRSWSRAEGGLPPVCSGIAFLVSEPLILSAAIVVE